MDYTYLALLNVKKWFLEYCPSVRMAHKCLNDWFDFIHIVMCISDL
jgi:hypothetical protein